MDFIRLSEVMSKVEESWKNIDIYNAGQSIKNFSTGVFPSHWLEMVKSRLYDGDEAAAWTLHRIVRDVLISLSPICPFSPIIFLRLFTALVQ